ncbi:hypothetical protein GCM10023219_31050 [Stakelama sediminis]|uniref:histidine kinase n=1 Tax=Stakelama sediminis TaxID=463200 RepID=A0A840Z1D1_9SPHN|nr:two-component system sensor histidine kinase KdpD [Stakelama sediminis]
MIYGEWRDYLAGIVAVAIITAITIVWHPAIGTASSALLFLLPVLPASVRGVRGAGLCTAAISALSYNFFLLPPRYTLRIHGFDNFVSVIVLFAVALVTTRLAYALKAREREAQAHADSSAEEAQFAAILAKGEGDEGVRVGLDWISARYGAVELIRDVESDAMRLGSLSASAAVWAAHHGEPTGHAATVMAAADWSFFPLGGDSDQAVLAVARPPGGASRAPAQIAQLCTFARLLGQARDRAALHRERTERQRLEDREELRRTFLASLAHDFRTPLTVIRGGLAELAANDARPELRALVRQAHRLDRMMDDLIGAARIESGALSPRMEATDMVDAVADAVDAVAPTLAQRRLDRSVPADLPLVRADPVLLRHILINLLDNAARHAASHVSITASKRSGRVFLLIADDGDGIPPGEETAMFERFVRLAGSDRTGGSGLGLSIARGFADAMGARLSAEPSGEGGARFVLDLPMLDGNDAA